MRLICLRLPVPYPTSVVWCGRAGRRNRLTRKRTAICKQGVEIRRTTQNFHHWTLQYLGSTEHVFSYTDRSRLQPNMHVFLQQQDPRVASLPTNKYKTKTPREPMLAIYVMSPAPQSCLCASADSIHFTVASSSSMSEHCCMGKSKLHSLSELKLPTASMKLAVWHHLNPDR